MTIRSTPNCYLCKNSKQMNTINTNYPLKSKNTFGFDIVAAHYAEAKTPGELIELLKHCANENLKLYILGGGSNVIFPSNFDGLVIHPSMDEISLIDETDEFATYRVGAGICWDSLVAFTVDKGLGGLENLSLIPGDVGACPIQNIGAYGVEAKDCIVSVEGVLRESMFPFELKNHECHFGYRDSIFKNELKGKVVITHVTFRLSKQPTLITHYGNLEEELTKYPEKSIKTVRQAVIAIRESKLPDPKELGNAGSFFKNPIVSVDLVKELEERFDRVPFYPIDSQTVKLPAGWLIEQSGWKGKRVGNVGVHAKQALVLVNHGDGTGTEVIQLAKTIINSVKQQFSVDLEMEVNVVE